MRREYRGLTESKRVKACGRPGGADVVLRLTDATGTAAQATTGASGRVAGFGGLFSCGNVHVCMVCAAKIAASRAGELESVLGHYIGAGGWALLATLTMRHHAHHTLKQCLAAAGRGWQAVNSGGAWQADKLRTGYAGYARALEVNESPENGWHVHYHVVIVFHERPSKELLDQVAEGMFARWSAGVVAEGMPAPTREFGLDVQHLEAKAAPEQLAEQSSQWGKYIAKGIAQEAALGISKEARGTNRSIRQLMRDATIPQAWEDIESGAIVETVDLTAQKRLLEYERAMKGRRQLTWSTGRHDLRKGANLEEELTDEQIAQSDLEGEDVAVLDRSAYDSIETRVPELYSVTERGGPEAARQWLDERGIPWRMPNRLTGERRHGERPGQVRFDRPDHEYADTRRAG